MASSATAASPSSLTLSQSLSLSRSLPAISQHPHRISLPTVNLSATSLKCSRRVGSRAAAVRASAAVDVAEKTETGLVEKSVNTIRFLAIDAVEKANSGHPGLPMGCAPMGHILYDEISSVWELED